MRCNLISYVPLILRREKEGVAGRRERAIGIDQVPVEMNEMDEAMQNAQISSEDDQATTNHDFGSTSMGCTQEFTQASGMIYQHTEIVPYMTPQTPQISRYPSLSALNNVFGGYSPQHFESAPNFTSSLVPMSIDIPDATNNLENLNTEMEDNELDDTNNEVNGNDPEDASTGCETTIQHDELSKKEKLTILTSTPKRKTQNRRKAKQKKAKSNGVMLDSSFFHSPVAGIVITSVVCDGAQSWESLLLLLPLLNSSSVKNFLRPFSEKRG
ncbi:hypothetical protein P3L10_021284 [Capsicum annuum]